MRSDRLRRARAGLLIGACLLVACSPTIRVHGYVPTQADLSQIRPGVDTYATVEETIGRPSSSGLLEDRSWYYVQSVVESYTYNPPRVVDRTVLAVEFDANGVVSGLASYGLEDGRIVNLTTRTTETGGRQLGVLEQLFGNLLTLDAEQFVDQ